MKKNIIASCILISSLFILQYNIFLQNNYCSLNTKDITNMYENYIDQWKMQSKKAFDEAESKIFFVPKPPVVVIPMEDPDPAKCICKGSGIITHGDGHKTPCQYHGNKQLKFKQLIILENHK